MEHPAATPEVDMLIVGAGFAGLYMLHKARRMGLNALVIEAAPSVGGTWYHNRYPGARVDIQSMEYSFSFDEALQQQWQWSERYAPQPELLRYANHVADRFGLRDGIRLSTRMAGAQFDETARRWTVQAEGGQRWSARFLVMASGPLSTPNRPDFAGLEDFAGPVFHTADWPHEPVDFTGQRVGIIGTGSSAVQAIPLIARQARELTVFQRTAAYAAPAHNGPLDREFEARIKADYAGFRARNRRMHGGFGSLLPPNPVSALAASAEEREAAFEQRWKVGGFAILGAFNDLLLNEQSNALAAQFVRDKIRSIVKDPVTAQLLSPTHTIGCKRLCVDSGYYDTFNRPNVKLVDISRDTDRAHHPHWRAQRRPRVQLRRAGARHRLRRDDRHDDAAGPARQRRLADPAEVACRTTELPGPDDRRFPQPVQHRRAGQHLGLHERDRGHRAARGLDRRLRGAPAHPWPGHHRGQRTGRSRVGRTRQCRRAAHRVPELQFVVPGRQHSRQATHVHAAGRWLPTIRRSAARRWRATATRALCWCDVSRRHA